MHSFLSSLVVVFFGVICLSGGNYFWGKVHGEGAIFRGVIVWRLIAPGAIVLTGNCPGGISLGGQFSSETIIWGAIIRGKIFIRGNFLRTEHQHYSGNIKVESDLSNYAKTLHLKVEIGLDTSNFATKRDLASLKNEVDEAAENCSYWLSEQSNVADNDVVK